MSESKVKKDRSPSFPFISLPDALKRLEAFDQTFGRHPAPASKSGLAWGMKEGSSQAFQTLAALKSFGLLGYEGSANAPQSISDGRCANLSEGAARFDKKEVVRRIATKPVQFQKFWSVWGADRPPDPICLDDLMLKHSFTDGAAHNFLKVYDETVAFAGLSSHDVDQQDGGESDHNDDVVTDFDVGDLINWRNRRSSSMGQAASDCCNRPARGRQPVLQNPRRNR